ncbi:unnamed protein product, partial [Scytosiphon promiscuus]
VLWRSPGAFSSFVCGRQPLILNSFSVRQRNCGISRLTSIPRLVISCLFPTRTSLKSPTVGGRCVVPSLSLCVSPKMTLRRVDISNSSSRQTRLSPFFSSNHILDNPHLLKLFAWMYFEEVLGRFVHHQFLARQGQAY